MWFGFTCLEPALGSELSKFFMVCIQEGAENIYLRFRSLLTFVSCSSMMKICYSPALPDRDLVNMEAIGGHYRHKGMDMASNNIQIGSDVQAILQTITNPRLIELLSPLTSDIKKPLLFTQLLLSRFLSLLLRPFSRNPREDGVQKPQEISNFSNT